jgi:hypothetical protein
MWRCGIIYTLLLLPMWADAQVPYLGGIANGNSHANTVGITLSVTDSLYNGGPSNGFATFAAIGNTMGLVDSMYNGGMGNGFTKTSILQAALYSSDSMYNGGMANGFAKTSILQAALYSSDSMYNGGMANGFTKTSILQAALYNSDSMYNGGTGNGFTQVITHVALYTLDSLYNGGTGKGEDEWRGDRLNLGICSDTLIWNGNRSVVWDDAANWDCGSTPSINSVVIIPAWAIRMPIVFGNATIRSLRLQSGASINVRPGVVLLLRGQ